MTDAASDDRDYVEATARAIGLPLAPEDLPAVLAIYSNLARVAAPLMAFPLPEEDELAPVFEPPGA
jgi:hypothetical protein